VPPSVTSKIPPDDVSKHRREGTRHANQLPPTRPAALTTQLEGRSSLVDDSELDELAYGGWPPGAHYKDVQESAYDRQRR
jgi:hypothetical protein